MVPDRGDIIYINFNPTKGHEQRGNRPALVISPAAFNAHTNTLWACPVTNQQRGWAFETSLDGYGTQTSGAIRADQIKTLDFNARGFTFKEKAPPDVTADVLAKIRAVLAQ
jgi:mRNA interferase MazF